ncbi:MAG: lysylphosphatidylglycerol synthase transmembrane domain-containing protein [Pelolinea sp.]|nr:lysylphosphatidylglycerol synthase transmembrane domain-containing protein [Pelolinea sp.]
MKKPNDQKFWRWAPGVLISCVALIILSKFININDLSQAISKYTIINIIVFVILIIIPLGFRGLAWKSLLQEISFKDSFLVINEGYFLNNLIPRSGEIARIFLTKSISGISAFHSAASIIFERGLDVVIAAGLFLSTIPLVVDLGWLRPVAIALIVLFCGVILGMVLVAVKAIKIETWLLGRNFRFNFFEKSIKPLLIKGIYGLTALAKPKNLIFGVFWILCSWIFWVSLLFYALRIIEPDAPIWWAIFAEGVLALGIALPSAPASLGVYEGTMVVALSILGIDKNSALSTAIILHSIQILITSLIGIIGLSVQGFSLVEIVNTISNRWKKQSEETGN